MDQQECRRLHQHRYVLGLIRLVALPSDCTINTMLADRSCLSQTCRPADPSGVRQPRHHSRTLSGTLRLPCRTRSILPKPSGTHVRTSDHSMARSMRWLWAFTQRNAMTSPPLTWRYPRLAPGATSRPSSSTSGYVFYLWEWRA